MPRPAKANVGTLVLRDVPTSLKRKVISLAKKNGVTISEQAIHDLLQFHTKRKTK